jgi:hypothetical protein
MSRSKVEPELMSVRFIGGEAYAGAIASFHYKRNAQGRSGTIAAADEGTSGGIRCLTLKRIFA